MRLISVYPNLRISSGEIYEAIIDTVNVICNAVRQVLNRTDPDLVADITEDGMYLTGGGALLYGMDKFVAEHTKVPCYVAEDPISCVAIGTGKVLDNIDKGFVNALYDYRRGDYFEA